MHAFNNTYTAASNCAPFTAWPWMVGFDRQFDTLSKMHQSLGRGSSYPPYNIIKNDEDSYTLEMAVAGFSKDEVQIQVKDDVLTISGSKTAKRDSDFMHKGIGTRDFNSEFVLDAYVEVSKAAMSDGILTISLDRRVPEEHKPKVIDIL